MKYIIKRISCICSFRVIAFYSSDFTIMVVIWKLSIYTFVLHSDDLRSIDPTSHPLSNIVLKNKATMNLKICCLP